MPNKEIEGRRSGVACLLLRCFLTHRLWNNVSGVFALLLSLGYNPCCGETFGAFHFSFNSSLKVDFQWSRVTSDAGLLVVRELDERLGLSELISDNLTDARHGRNTQLPLPDLLRQSIDRKSTRLNSS